MEQTELDVLKQCNKNKPRNCPIKGIGPLGRKPRGRDGTGSKGDGELVKNLQKMLKTLGFDLGASGQDNDGIDGIFGKKTEKAVIEFQMDKRYDKDWGGKRLDNDGMVGPKTADALNRAMVGKWYPKYTTPKELTKDTLYITAVEDVLKGEGLILDPKDLKKAKIVLLGTVDGFRITLMDLFDEPYYFEDERSYEILDEDENLLGEGKIKSGEEIKFTSTKNLFEVRLYDGEEYDSFFLSPKKTSSSEKET
jgi:hypothetical protein